MRAPGISATISITGGMYLCAERTEKFGGRVAEEHGGGRDGGRLEPCREEDDFVPRRTSEIDRLRDAVHDVDPRAAGLRVPERHRRARDPQHVAVGGDPDALLREGDGLVDLRHVGDAHRAAGPHDHLERLGEHGAQAVARDGLLVAAAHVHDRDRVAADLRGHPSQRARELRARSGSRNASKTLDVIGGPSRRAPRLRSRRERRWP